MPLPRAMVFAAEAGLPSLAAWLARHSVALQEPTFIAWQALAADADSKATARLADPAVKFDVRAYGAHLATRQFGQRLCYQPVISSTQTILNDAAAAATSPAPPSDAAVAAAAAALNAFSSSSSGGGGGGGGSSEDDNEVGTVTVLSDVQLEGRGRGSNKWESPEGCLSFSFLANFAHGASLPFVQYLVSLAVVRAIKKARGDLLADLPVHIKWPNDIYVDRAVKIGGVLCNAQHDPRSGRFTVVVGIGINVNNSAPTTCLNDVIRAHCGGDESGDGKTGGDGTAMGETVGSSGGVPGAATTSSGAAVAAADAPTLTREELLARIFNEFEALHTVFVVDGFAAFVEEYTANWLHSGQQVRVQRGGTDAAEVAAKGEGGDEDEAEVGVAARIVGISETGNLTVQLLDAAGAADGPVQEVIPDTTSLDMLQGLVTRKTS